MVIKVFKIIATIGSPEGFKFVEFNLLKKERKWKEIRESGFAEECHVVCSKLFMTHCLCIFSKSFK